jgi:hypothetical protein
VRNPFGLTCPDCGSSHIQVEASGAFIIDDTGVRLFVPIDYKSGARQFEQSITLDDAEWAGCDCGFSGQVGDLIRETPATAAN